MNLVADSKMQRGLLDKYDKMTSEATKALALYTLEVQIIDMEATPFDEFYRVYGDVMRRWDPVSMRKLHGYSYHFLAGLRALPAYKGDLWRGIRGRKAVLLAVQNYERELKEIVWTTPTSAAVSRDISADFALREDIEDRPEDDTKPDLFP